MVVFAVLHALPLIYADYLHKNWLYDGKYNKAGTENQMRIAKSNGKKFLNPLL